MRTKTLTVRLPRPHLNQQQVISNARRYNVLVAGRRWGKTLLGQDRAIQPVLHGFPVGWFAPTYRYLTEPFRELCRKLEPIMRTAPNKTEHRIECITGGTLEGWSLDSGNAGRGRAYKAVIIDEAALVMDLREIFQAAIRPTLTDYKGDAWFLSTPKGYDDFHGFYEWGQDPGAQYREWASWRMPTSTNPHIDPMELDAARLTMDPRFYAQEYEASFEQVMGRVYFRFDREANIGPVSDPGGELLIGMDFNVSPMSAIVATRAGDELHVFDELELMNSDTAEMCQAIRSRYPNRRIVVMPDPSGNARKTSAPVGRTDFSILRDAGFSVMAPSQAPPVVDRINEVNALCCNAQGRRRLRIDPRCRALIRSLTQLLYKDGASVVDKGSGLDHMADALGYLVHAYFPIAAPVNTTRIRWG